MLTASKLSYEAVQISFNTTRKAQTRSSQSSHSEIQNFQIVIQASNAVETVGKQNICD